MDVESKETINQAIDRAKLAGDEIVDHATANVRDQILVAASAAANSLVVQFSNVLSGVLQGLQATLDKTMHDLKTTVEGLDGWTVTIGIPPITIRLSKPKEKP